MPDGCLLSSLCLMNQCCNQKQLCGEMGKNSAERKGEKQRDVNDLQPKWCLTKSVWIINHQQACFIITSPEQQFCNKLINSEQRAMFATSFSLQTSELMPNWNFNLSADWQNNQLIKKCLGFYFSVDCPMLQCVECAVWQCVEYAVWQWVCRQCHVTVYSVSWESVLCESVRSVSCESV